MLDLSRCTLLFVETRAHEISKRVIEDCLQKARFGEVLIYTNDRTRIAVPDAHYVDVPDWPTKKEAGHFYYSEAMLGVRTDFALMLEWDGGIYDPNRWRNEFFEYDYIGAPWITRDNLKVGNGGFTLMSQRLGHFLATHRDQYPVFTDWDVCRTQRDALEKAGGFKWPSFELAGKFSWELAPRDAENFGFHGAFNWPQMLAREELIERAKLLTTTPYLLSKMRDLVKHAPWLETAIGPELWAKYTAVHPMNQPVPPRGTRIGLPHGYRPPNTHRLIQQRRALMQDQINRGLKA